MVPRIPGSRNRTISRALMFPIEIVWQIAPTAGLGNTNPNRPVTTMMMEDDVSVTLMELR